MSEEQVLIGGYRVKRYMWTGQHSQVLEVVEPKSNRHFAMKILLPEMVQDPDARAELFHEAEMGMRFAHPNIIKIIKENKDKSNPHFVMEFFPAGSLKSRILHMEQEKAFLREHSQFIFKQWATALAFLNSQGYVHRDIKPDNILVNGYGEAKLIDFALVQKIPSGLSRVLSLGRISAGIARAFTQRRAGVAGTRSYMSPEQIRGERLDGRTDIYSFGASLFEVLTGRPPFRGGTSDDLLNKHLTEKPLSPCAFNPDVTREFGDFVLKLLSKKKEDRPENFHQILMQLRTLRIFKSMDFKAPTH